MKIKKRIFIEEDFQSKLLKEIHAEEIIDINKILPLVTPGTELRQGLDEILHGNLGALIVLGNSDGLKGLLRGGIDLDILFSSQKLFELSKMDGAIVLSNDLTKIIGANKHLMPNKNIASKETGMRHRSAEQTAIESKVPVIAISHRRNVISLYYKDQKYVLQEFNMLMVKANYAINNLKDFRNKLDKKLKHILFLEINNSSNLSEEIIEIIQNMLYFIKHEKQVDDLVVELGNQGQDIANTLYELTVGIDEELSLILRDYSNTLQTKEVALDKISTLKQMGIRKIADTERLIEILDLSDFISLKSVDFPRGYRILASMNNLDEKIIENLVKVKKSINNIKNLTLQDLAKIKSLDLQKAKNILDTINKIYTKKFM
jgi:diadenylate cyclase